LRDVYQWNFLTKRQLGMQVCECSLEQWVAKNDQRGHIEALNDRVSLWEVAETNLEMVRKYLHEAGVIFDRRKHLA